MDISLFQSLSESHTILAAGGIAPDALLGWFTNSIFVALIVLTLVLLFTRSATRRMALIPDGKQNLVEMVVEFLYGQVEGIVGKRVAPKAFPLLATFFIFILVSNWIGLVPGVGTVGFGPKTGHLTIDMEAVHAASGHGGEAHGGDDAHGKPAEAEEDHDHPGHGAEDGKSYWDTHYSPLLRSPTADLNMTLGMAAVFMLVWAWITVREVGVWGFIVHTFGPKGGLTGILKWVLIPIFIFVGLIEIISIAFRPVSLSLRLLGNVYAGETLLHTMGELGNLLGLGTIGTSIIRVVAPLPFYFLEILVGLIQSIVFTLLCAVYIQLSTSHEEEHEH